MRTETCHRRFRHRNLPRLRKPRPARRGFHFLATEIVRLTSHRLLLGPKLGR